MVRIGCRPRNQQRPARIHQGSGIAAANVTNSSFRVHQTMKLVRMVVWSAGEHDLFKAAVQNAHLVVCVLPVGAVAATSAVIFHVAALRKRIMMKKHYQGTTMSQCVLFACVSGRRQACTIAALHVTTVVIQPINNMNRSTYCEARNASASASTRKLMLSTTCRSTTNRHESSRPHLCRGAAKVRPHCRQDLGRL